MAAVIGQITDSNEITRQASEKEVVNMCTALEKWEKRAEEHGAEKTARNYPEITEKGLQRRAD